MDTPNTHRYIHTPELDRLRTLKPSYNNLSKEADFVYKTIRESMDGVGRQNSSRSYFQSMDMSIAQILHENGFKLEGNNRQKFNFSQLSSFRLPSVCVSWDADEVINPFL